MGQEWIVEATLNPMLWFIYYIFHIYVIMYYNLDGQNGGGLSPSWTTREYWMSTFGHLVHRNSHVEAWAPLPPPPAPCARKPTWCNRPFNQFLFTVLKFVVMSTAHVISALFGRSTKNCIILSGWTTNHPLGLYFGKLNILWVPSFLIHPPSTKSL